MKPARPLALVLLTLATACTVDGPRTERERAVRGDAPIKGGSEAFAYPEAVVIDMDGSACSGALIAPQVVLTAGHCVYGFGSFYVIAPYASPPQAAYGVKGVTMDWNGSGQTVDPNQHDVAVIHLDKPIQIPSYPQVAKQAVAFGTKAHNIGRIDNGQFSDQQLFVGPAVTLKNGAAVGYPLDYYASDVIQPGDSGGPVVLPGAAPHTVVAVNSGSDGVSTEVLARVDLVSAWLADQIANGPANPSDPNPPSDPPAPDPGGGCSHGLCSVGAPLDPGCDGCAGYVCSFDPYCCETQWDAICIDESLKACGPVCG
jgi:V8-like Glu-specific endopeptidase